MDLYFKYFVSTIATNNKVIFTIIFMQKKANI